MVNVTKKDSTGVILSVARWLFVLFITLLPVGSQVVFGPLASVLTAILLYMGFIVLSNVSADAGDELAESRRISMKYERIAFLPLKMIVPVLVWVYSGSPYLSMGVFVGLFYSDFVSN